MRNFELIKRGNYMFVQTVNYNNPINSLNEVTTELIKLNFEGSVVFDLLLANGNTSARFLKSNFINRKFEMSSFKKTIISKRTRKEIIIYYKTNKSYLNNSILSPSLIRNILNERCLDE